MGESADAIAAPSGMTESVERDAQVDANADINRRTGRAALSAVPGARRPDRIEGRAWEPPVEIERAARLSPLLPDLRLEGGRFSDAPLRARTWISLEARGGMRLLASVSGYIATSLQGRVPFIVVDNEQSPRNLLVQFCIEDTSAETYEMINEFTRGVLKFLDLSEDTPVSTSIETDEQYKRRIPESVRRRLGI